MDTEISSALHSLLTKTLNLNILKTQTIYFELKAYLHSAHSVRSTKIFFQPGSKQESEICPWRTLNHLTTSLFRIPISIPNYWPPIGIFQAEWALYELEASPETITHHFWVIVHQHSFTNSPYDLNPRQEHPRLLPIS